MKTRIKDFLFGFIICLVLVVVVGVSASIVYNASEINFVPENSTWNVSTVEDAINDINNRCAIKNDLIGEEWTFNYTGSYEIFDIPYTGVYKIELWGAQGGNGNSTYTGGKGAYTSGQIYLEKENKIYLYVGQTGYSNSNAGVTTFNGGGYCGYTPANNWYAGSGGGATDVRLVSGEWNSTESIASRIMVAAGGGGGAIESNNTTYSGNGGPGGTLNGIIGTNMGTSSAINYGLAPSQTSGATSYSSTSLGVSGFGYGGNSYNTVAGAGGGGGYYGGGGASNSAPGAGGSSYISGYTGCVAITSQTDTTPKSGCTTGTSDIECSKHYSGYIFSETVMKAGNQDMPSHDGKSYITGNSGNGYAKITLVSLD